VISAIINALLAPNCATEFVVLAVAPASAGYVSASALDVVPFKISIISAKNAFDLAKAVVLVLTL
jgi:hypothetical protein